MGGSVPELSKIGGLIGGQHLRNFREEVASLLKRESLHFPGAQPVSFARKHLRELEREDYYVCEKSDGIRCLLYFTHGSSGEEIHYLIDRKNDYYFVQGLHFPVPPPEPDKQIDWGTFYTKTLLDGELLYDTLPSGDRVLKYLVFDCLLLGGVNLMPRTLDKRLGYFKDKLYQPYLKLCETFPEDISIFPFRIEEKSVQVGYAAEMMFKDVLPNLMHGHDGLIFTCRTTPYQYGTDEHILKWKPAKENTIDFKLGLDFPTLPDMDVDGEPDYDYYTMPEFTLHVNHSHGDDRPYAPMFVTLEEWQQMKQWSIEHDNGLDGQVVECYRDTEGRWRFGRFRGDKQEGNYFKIVESILKSIEDSVSEEELIAAAGKVKRAWKERMARRAEEEKRKQFEQKKRDEKQRAEALKKQQESARLQQAKPKERTEKMDLDGRKKTKTEPAQ